MAKNLSKITIGGREIEVENDEWPIEKFHLDLANPRYAHIPEGEREDEGKMEKAIWAEEASKELYQSIKINKGLITPIYARQDGTIVEGNRRVVSLRHLRMQIDARKEDAKKYSRIVERVPCRVFPEDFSLEERALFLASEHVSGKKPWPAMNEAAHIWSMNNDLAYSMEELARYLGKNKTFIHQKIWAFEKTRDYWKYNPKDKDVLRFSYFEEFYKLRGSLNYDEKKDPEQARTLLTFIFQGIKDKRFNVEGAKDLRYLPKILADKDAKEAFLSGTEHRGEKLIGTEAGLRVLEERYPSTAAFQAIKQTLDQLNRMPHAEYAEIPTYARKGELMYLLRDKLDAMIKDLGLKRPVEVAN